MTKIIYVLAAGCLLFNVSKLQAQTFINEDNFNPSIKEVEAKWTSTNLVEIELGFTKKPIDIKDVFIGFSDGKTEAEWYRMEEIVRTMNFHPVDSDIIEATIETPQSDVNGFFVRVGDDPAIYTSINGKNINDDEVAELMRVKAQTVCHPQCTDYVYGKTNINFKNCWKNSKGEPIIYGNAGEWYDHAKKCGFSTSSTPKDGVIGELKSPGHVFMVYSSKKTSSSKYDLVVGDRNWNLNCGERKSFKAQYDKNTGKITMGGSKLYSVTQ